MLQTITGSFASAGGGLPELGLGAAETNVVLSAWSRHLALSKTARYFKWRATLVTVALFVISLLTALVAVLYAVAQVNPKRARDQAAAVKRRPASVVCPVDVERAAARLGAVEAEVARVVDAQLQRQLLANRVGHGDLVRRAAAHLCARAPRARGGARWQAKGQAGAGAGRRRG